MAWRVVVGQAGAVKRRRGIFLVVCLVVVAGILAAAAWPREREPVYKGKWLTEWLIIYANPDTPPPQLQEAKEAVRHIGTNALPWLLTWAWPHPHPWKRKVSAILQKLPGSFRLTPDHRDDFRIGVAWVGFQMLGKDALPPLIGVLTNSASPDRPDAAFMLGALGSNALPAVPELVKSLESSNMLLVIVAANTLGQLALEPGMVVAALANCVTNSQPMIRQSVMRALGHFGQEGRPAIPALSAGLNDADSSVREAATNALLKIAPEVLEKGGRRPGGPINRCEPCDRAPVLVRDTFVAPCPEDGLTCSFVPMAHIKNGHLVTG
jgi:hypothetical protein